MNEKVAFRTVCLVSFMFAIASAVHVVLFSSKPVLFRSPINYLGI